MNESQKINFNEKNGFICDMDGVIYHGNQILPGVAEFIQWLHDEKKEYLFLTNNSGYTPKELNQKLARMGLDVPEEHFYTSALATAAFLKEQAPGCSVFAIGEAGLLNALYDAGITMNDVNPDYVVVGEGKILFSGDADKGYQSGAFRRKSSLEPILTCPAQLKRELPLLRRIDCPHWDGDRNESIFLRKAKSFDDEDGLKAFKLSFRRCSNGRRQNGYRHYFRNGERHVYGSGIIRRINYGNSEYLCIPSWDGAEGSGRNSSSG